MKEQNLDTIFNYILNPKYRWLFHILFWIVIFSEDFNSLYEMGSDICPTCFVLDLVIKMAVVYFNIYFLFSKFLVKGKIFHYTIYTILTILIFAYINIYFFYEESFLEIVDEETGEVETLVLGIAGTVIAYGFRIFSIIGTAVGIKFFKRYFIEKKQFHAIKEDSLENELLYLKNQINPHFLFNSLNNIYVQSKKNLSNTSDSILLLSDLLRYQLYDCAKKYVTLSSEIEYLQNFIQLEKLRKKDSTITLEVSGNPLHKMVAPFIFMPFIENAVKYSGQTDKPEVTINFNIDNKKIMFSVKNNKLNSYAVKKDSGIGLSNVKRRLELLYPKSHELIINESLSLYEVSLELTLDTD